MGHASRLGREQPALFMSVSSLGEVRFTVPQGVWPYRVKHGVVHKANSAHARARICRDPSRGVRGETVVWVSMLMGGVGTEHAECAVFR